MGEEKSAPKPDQENPKKNVDAESAHLGLSAGGEVTVDPVRFGAESEGMAEARMSIGPYVLVRNSAKAEWDKFGSRSRRFP